jgi:hypothetical protein
VVASIGLGISHAPQLWLRPPDEVDEVNAWYDAAHAAAARLRDLDLDAIVVIGNDHLHSTFLDMVVPFTVVTSARVRAELITGVGLEEPGTPALAESLVERMIDDGFEVAFSQSLTADHSVFIPLAALRAGGLTVPAIPMLVNCYVPPQPTLRRCFELGERLGAWAEASGSRVGVIGTGGLSHFPGTPRYRDPDREADEELLTTLREGKPEDLLRWDAKELDRRGLVELRSWMVALGARAGDMRPNQLTYQPSWHCGYTVVEF